METPPTTTLYGTLLEDEPQDPIDVAKAKANITADGSLDADKRLLIDFLIDTKCVSTTAAEIIIKLSSSKINGVGDDFLGMMCLGRRYLLTGGGGRSANDTCKITCIPLLLNHADILDYHPNMIRNLT